MHSWQAREIQESQALTKSVAISTTTIKTEKVRTSLNNLRPRKTLETEVEKPSEAVIGNSKPDQVSITNKIVYLKPGDTDVILYFITGSASKCKVKSNVTISYRQDTEIEYERNIELGYTHSKLNNSHFD